ncbi:MAG: hypothetical protein DRI57_21225 [Deltaproteobacteria bacterium]|nr:MAG: hypothetical protein DRI57_21225 [Deltaproteobacteria bacterium]
MKKIIVGLLAMVAFSSAAYADVIIIANKDVPENTLSRKEIKEIFFGKRVQWSDHRKIHVTTLKDTVIHKMFLKQYLNKSHAKWKSYWKRMIFTGRGVPPKSVRTEAELIEYIAETKGAVGYVSSEGIPDDSETIVKIIKVR